MGYSFRMSAEDSSENPNYTSNVSGMWKDKKERHVSELEGMKGKKSAKRVLLIITEMLLCESWLRETKTPKNGWGDYDGALKTMFELYGMLLKWPKSELLIYR